MRTIVAIIGLLVITGGVALAQPAAHRAGLVVQYADGSVQTACVAFPEDAISGLDLLERSGIPLVTQASGIGAAVCKIGPDGCDYPAEGCFCKRDGPRAVYWAYQVLDGSSWRYASLGAANVRVHDGDVNGWAWGAGDSSAGAQPPALGIDAVCAQQASLTEVATAPLTSPATPRVAPSGAATTVVPAPTATTPTPAGGSAPASNYLAFGAIAAVLAIGAAIAAVRRRGSSEGP
jgi:hypothetical protein